MVYWQPAQLLFNVTLSLHVVQVEHSIALFLRSGQIGRINSHPVSDKQYDSKSDHRKDQEEMETSQPAQKRESGNLLHEAGKKETQDV